MRGMTSWPLPRIGFKSYRGLARQVGVTWWSHVRWVNYRAGRNGTINRLDVQLEGFTDMTPICLTDFKGDPWALSFVACQINKRNCRWHAFWRVIDGPGFLKQNGANYDFIDTEIFTDWF